MGIEYKGKDTKRWIAWVIRRNRIENVIGYIRDNVPEVDKFFYPQVKKQYKNRRGTYLKDRPLYEGYIFLRYNNFAAVFHKLNKYPFITTCAGPVTDKEISLMQEAQGKLLTETKVSKFVKGDIVILLSGPFKGFMAEVVIIQHQRIRVRVNTTILGQSGVEVVYHEDQVQRKSELDTTQIQNI